MLNINTNIITQFTGAQMQNVNNYAKQCKPTLIWQNIKMKVQA